MTETEPTTLRAAAMRPVDATIFRWFRIGFGALMAIATLRYFAHGWIREYFIEPTHFFHYKGFSWVQPLPGAGMYVVFGAMLVLSLGIAFGIRTRISAALFGALFLYAHLCDKTNYLNHYFLVVYLCALIAILPIEGRSIPAWAIWVLRGQIACVYIFGGIAKLSPDWLIHAQPLQIWLSTNTDFPIIGGYFAEPWVAHVFAIGGCLFDLLVVPALLYRRTRPFAYVAIAVFHLTTAKLFHIGMFPWIMMCASLMFLPMRERPGAVAAPRRWWIAVWFAIQIALPLRHWLYPGNQLWTEEGFRFSWNVMLMEKQGSVEFHVREPSTGRTWEVAPTAYLTRYQTKMMSSQPDMILELAHQIADDFRTRGHVVEVRVDAFASLNGRPARRLIDPAVDLAREDDDFFPKSWIVPL